MIWMRWTMLALVVGLAGACASDDAACDDEVAAQRLGLSGAARRPRSEVIRDVALANGVHNGALLGGIAQVETGLSHCWSEATWACQGPFSASCDGPVIAGSADGPCAERRGGLGLFQFDGGSYEETLERDGEQVLLLEGNIAHAVEFVLALVRREFAPESDAAALAWLNAVPIVRDDPIFEQWNALLACRYNGRCGSETQASKYREATLSALTEFEPDFWDVDIVSPPDTAACGSLPSAQP